MSSDGIAEALKRSASTLVESGNSFEQSIAMVAAANKVIQDPEQVGAALKVLSMRIRGTKTELEAMGESTDDMATTTSKLRDQILALTNVDGKGGVDIFTENGEYRDTYDILMDIAEVYDDILATDNKDAAALTELLAGKHRANVLSSLLQNQEDLKEAYEMAQNAEGSAIAENERYLDSIQGRIDIFINSLQTFWMNFASSDFIKGVVDAGTTLIKILDTIPGKIAAVVGGFMVYKRVTTEGLTFPIMFANIADGAKAAYTAIQSIITATKGLEVANISLALSNSGVTKELVAEILATSGLAGVEGILTAEKIKATAATLSQMYATGQLTAAQYLATMSTMGLRTALQGLWTVLTANPVYIVIAAVAGLALAFDKIHKTAQEAADAAQNAFDDIKQAVESTESAIQSLETELSEIQTKIDELNGNKLSFAEDQELKRLKAQKKELEHSLDVQESILELQKKSQAEQAVASMKAYTKAASQGAAETQKSAKTWMTILGAVAGVAGVLAAPITGGASLGLVALGGAAGGIAGNKIGEAVGSGITANDGSYDDWYKTYTKALDTARAEEEKALKNYEKDSSNIDKLDKWQEAQQKTTDIETEMYEHLSQMQSYYNTLEYGMSDEIDKELDTWNQFLDKFAIDQNASGAKATALDRIFGENASDEIKAIKAEIKEAVVTGKDFDFSKAINDSEELKSALEYVGLEVKDVKDYFTQLGEKAFIDENVTSFKGYSALLTQVEAYNTALSQTSDYLFNNVEVTQEYKDSLTALGIGQEELADCFYENNDLIVKNADALNDLVDAARDNVAANIDIAESHTRLKYYDLVNQLNEVCGSTDEFTKSSSNLAHSLLDQIDAVQQTIYKYHLLQNSLNGANGAFVNFTEAKNIDSLNNTGTTMIEMMQTLYDGFYKTGEVGTQAFEAAIDGLIPDSVLAGLESKGDQLEATFKYYKEELLPTLTNDSDTISIGAGDINSFIQEAINAGVLARDKNGDLDISKKALSKEWDFEDVGKKMGYSEAYVNAMMHEVDKNLFDDNLSVKFSQGFEKFDNQILEITENIEDANRQKLDLLDRRRLTKDKDEIAAIDKEIAELNTTIQENKQSMGTLGETAAAQYEKYAKNEAAIAGLTEIQENLSDTEKLTATLTQDQATELGLEWKEGKTVQQYLDECLSRKDRLGEPTELTIQYALQGLADETDDLISQIEDQLGRKTFKAKIQPYIDKNDDGTYSIDTTSDSSSFTRDNDGNIVVKEGSYSEEELSTLQQIAENVNYQEDLQDISSSAVTAETHLADISANVAGILGKLGGDPVQSGTKDGNKGGDKSSDSKGKHQVADNNVAGYDADSSLFKFNQDKEARKALENTKKLRQEHETLYKTWSKTKSAEDRKWVSTKQSEIVASVVKNISYIDGLVEDDKELVINAVTKYENSEGGTGDLSTLLSDLKSIEDEQVRTEVVATLVKGGSFDSLLSGLNDKKQQVVIEAIVNGEGDISQLNNVISKIKDEKVQAEIYALVDDALDDATLFEGKLKKLDETTITSEIKTSGRSKAQKDLDDVANSAKNIPDTVKTEMKTGGMGKGVKDLEDVADAADNIPKTVQTKVSTPGADSAKKKLQDAGKAADDIDGKTPSITLSIGVVERVANAWKALKKKFGWANGTVQMNYVAGANGTAHAKGTAWAGGTAHKGGNWGAPRTETALTGELGPELIVRGNRWFTVGDKGAEFAHIQKGDIIFNHKQTEELLSNGYVTSRGKAFAQGTAYGGATWSVDTNTSNGSYTVKKSGKSKASKKTSEYSKDFEEVFDWFEIKIEEINEDLDLMAAKLENAVTLQDKNSILDSMIKANKSELTTLEKGLKLYNSYANTLLKKIPKKYQAEAKDGKIAIEEFAGKTDEKTLEAIKNYREWAQKAAEISKQIQEVQTEIAQLAKQQFDNISDYYSIRVDLQAAKKGHIEDMIDLQEARGELVSEEYYQELIWRTQGGTKNFNGQDITITGQLEQLAKEREQLQAKLDDLVTKGVANGGIEKGSDVWYEMVSQIHDVDSQIDECTANLEEYQNAINEIHWNNFDELIKRLDYVNDEAQRTIDLMSNEDMFTKNDSDQGWGDKDVPWSKEGLATIGLYGQKMEIAKKKSQEYAEQITYLEQAYKDGKYSESEYLEKLDELKKGQHDAIQEYRDSEEAIRDLNEARIDHVKEGIDKEIEALEELIDKKKEELDAEKDLYDFQKSVMEQQKDISKLERQLTALAGDNSASAMAKRRKLEAELAEAKEALDETYYERSIENQKTALDKELETFQEEKDAEIEALEKTLENTEQLVTDSMKAVESTGSEVLSTLTSLAEEYGVKISDALTSPWNDASTAINKTVENINAIETDHTSDIDTADTNAANDVNERREANVAIESAEKYVAPASSTSSSSSSSSSSKTSSSSSTKKSYPYGKASETSGNIKSGATGKKVKAIQWALKEMGYSIGKSGVDGIFGSATKSAVKKFQKKMGISADGIVGKNTRKKFKAKGYATGTTGVKKDQWALIDELGEELVIGANNGRLTYLKKGSGVVPADLTSNLMDWGELNPQDVLDRNRPSIGASPEVHATEINLNIQYGDMLKIENFKGDNPDEIAKIVAKQFEKHTAQLNQSLRKYVR